MTHGGFKIGGSQVIAVSDDRVNSGTVYQGAGGFGGGGGVGVVMYNNVLVYQIAVTRS